MLNILQNVAFVVFGVWKNFLNILTAYTIINIEGKSFCPASKKAFLIVVENALRVATINSVGDFMLFLAKMSVTVVTVIIAVLMLEIPLKTSSVREIFYFIFI